MEFQFHDSILGNPDENYGPSLDFLFMDNHNNNLLLPDLDSGISNSNSNWNSDSVPSSILSLEGDYHSDDSDLSDTVLRYVNQMLMEEDLGENPCNFLNPMALQEAEKSLYDVIGQKYLPSPNQHSLNLDHYYESPDDHFSGSCSDNGSSHSSSVYSNSVNSPWSNISFADCQQKPFFQTPLSPDFVFQTSAKSNVESAFGIPKNLVESSITEISDSSLFGENELALHFKRGFEEASKFLPKGNHLVINLESKKWGSLLNKKDLEIVVKTEMDENDFFLNRSRGRKNHERDDVDLEDERKSKQLAGDLDETELSDMFDKLLVCGKGREEPSMRNVYDIQERKAQKEIEGPKIFNIGTDYVKQQLIKKESVDLTTLLILCAQAVSNDDCRTANELLKKIKLHSSPFGDGTQRLAHCVANGLEARLAGTGTQIYNSLSSKKRSAADMLKAYRLYVSACPFKRFSIIFANHMILSLAEKAKTIHIIDFGILYGFQWPVLIHRLSERPGGPPKLRITGIDLPESGFRPAERVQQTGHRLAKYCRRLNVPFEYNAIASRRWETLRIEDLKIERNEVLVVNSIFCFKNLLDETVVVNSPKNAVLNLIRKINPAIFIHSVINGSYNSPFFVTRFKEALFHLSAMYDMFDANVPREDPTRMMFEKEFLEREAINVIACEGLERAERPETYKRWQVRTTRAGFRQIPLDPEIIKKLKDKVKTGYHNDFMVDGDGNWMVQGWKGRIVCASSCWVLA